MSRSPNAEARPAGRPPPRLERRLWLARLALYWERLWPALWPAVGVCGLFLALALFDVLPRLPGWLHLLVLMGFGATFGFALWRAVSAHALPDAGRARRRLETQSGLAHRPLSVLKDRLAAGASDPDAQALWRLHRRRMLESVRNLRVGLPTAGLARRDPYALRGVLILVLAIAAAGAWNDGANRLARAVTPDFTSLDARTLASLEIWITPPAYTGLAPVFLKSHDGPTGPLAVPVGSTLLAQLHGGRGVPRLKLDEAAKAFSATDVGSYKVTAAIESGTRLAVEQDGNEIAAWRLSIIPDAEPEIRFPARPAQTNRAALRLEYQAEDDYGISQTTAFIRRVGPATTRAGKEGEAIELGLPLPGAGPKTAREASYHDLTAHPWAGLPVSIQLMARDGIGQLGVSEPHRTVLPERIFYHPVARAIIEIRKRLSIDPNNRGAVMRELYGLSAAPEDFRHDAVVFLALRTARARLGYDRADKAIPEVQLLLWDTALRLEDGRLSIAQRELRALQRALMDALARRAGNAEIEKLLDRLQTALNRFLESIFKNLKNQPKTAMPFDPSAQYLTAEDLQRMLDRARELARTGSYDAARQLLAMLSELLENLRAGNFAMMPGRGDNQAWNMMRGLREMMRRQQQLLDRTFRDSRQGAAPGRPRSTGQTATEQDALRRALGELMRRLGEATGQIPRAFGRAERAMRGAVDALRRNAPGEAVGPQGEALDQLQQGAGAMMQQLMKQFGQGPLPRGMRGRLNRMERAYDPLGRPLSSTGAYSGEDVNIPDESEIQRAREILRELRRRAGEIDRPRLEKDYIDRLLRRF
ncbi:MAG: TIGR02302 family protein [Alphaproteobacteria bacterium]